MSEVRTLDQPALGNESSQMRVNSLPRPAKSLTNGRRVGFPEVVDYPKNPGIRLVPNHPPMVADEQVSPAFVSIEFEPHRRVLYVATLSLKDVRPVLLVQPEGHVGGGREGRATPNIITDVSGKSFAVMNHHDVRNTSLSARQCPCR